MAKRKPKKKAPPPRRKPVQTNRARKKGPKPPPPPPPPPLRLVRAEEPAEQPPEDPEEAMLFRRRWKSLMCGKFRTRNGSAWEKFLEALEVTGNITVSAQLAGVSRATVYTKLEKDPDFQGKVRAATEGAWDLREAEMDRRAFVGTEKPVFYEGLVAGHVTEYDGTLAMFLHKGRRPQMFRDKVTVNHEGATRPTDAASLLAAVSAFMGAVEQTQTPAGSGTQGGAGQAPPAGAGAPAAADGGPGE